MKSNGEQGALPVTPNSCPAPSLSHVEQTQISEDKGSAPEGTRVRQNGLPLADVIEQRYPVTIQFCVWINNWLVCGTDRRYIADMVARAINAWSYSEDGLRWFREQVEGYSVSDGGGSPATGASSENPPSPSLVSSVGRDGKQDLGDKRSAITNPNQ